MGLQRSKRGTTEKFMAFLILESSYENSMRISAPFLWNLPGANDKTNTQDARKALGSLSPGDNEQTVSLDVKSLYTNVPVGESVKTALRELYSSSLAPENARFAIKS